MSRSGSQGAGLRVVDGASDEARDAVQLRTRLVAMVQRACARWTADARDDVVQQAVERVLRQRHRSAQERTFNDAYLKQVVYSVVVDQVRRDRTARTSPDHQVDRFADDDVRSPERATHAREVGLAIRDCLEATTETRRRAVWLYLLGHSVPQAARTLGFTPKKTENLVYRGLAALRDCLTGKGVTP